jgi:hypothetical protein
MLAAGGILARVRVSTVSNMIDMPIALAFFGDKVAVLPTIPSLLRH